MSDFRPVPARPLTRRRLLAASALVPAAGLVGAPRVSRAQDGAARPLAAPPLARGFRLGDFEVATLLAGTRTAENPQETFGMNVSPETFAEVSEANFIPADRNQFFFTPTVVRTGEETILFDAGLDAGGIAAALGAVGIAPEDVDVVVLTHMHGDHIGGLADEAGAPTFANARYVTGQVEFDAWAKRDDEGFEAKVRPLAEKTSFLGDGDEVAPGITAMAAFGHTPGHMAYHLESGDRRLVLIADTANHYVWSLARPDWEVRFDMDKAAAAETRKRVLGMLAAERVPFVGYHMPFPAVGYVAAREGGRFEYVPTSYQMML